jgi:hypothetical protein
MLRVIFNYAHLLISPQFELTNVTNFSLSTTNLKANFSLAIASQALALLYLSEALP